MSDASQNELPCRLIFLIRLLKADTVVGWDPRAQDEENPSLANARCGRGLLKGRVPDVRGQFAAGLAPRAVQEKYYARWLQITRVAAREVNGSLALGIAGRMTTSIVPPLDGLPSSADESP